MEPKSSRLVIYAVEMGKLISCIVGTLSMLFCFFFKCTKPLCLRFWILHFEVSMLAF